MALLLKNIIKLKIIMQIKVYLVKIYIFLFQSVHRQQMYIYELWRIKNEVNILKKSFQHFSKI